MREPFALLRGLTVHEIVRHRHAVWLSASRDGLDVAYDHVRAAARVYARVRAAFADAVTQERRRCLLLQRQMRAAGLPASSCLGPHSPMAGWRATWEDTGVCTVHGDVVTQQLLPDQPLTSLAVTPLARVFRETSEDDTRYFGSKKKFFGVVCCMKNTAPARCGAPPPACCTYGRLRVLHFLQTR